jgi:plasmid stabilization system protein ParE
MRTNNPKTRGAWGGTDCMIHTVPSHRSQPTGLRLAFSSAIVRLWLRLKPIPWFPAEKRGRRGHRCRYRARDSGRRPGPGGFERRGSQAGPSVDFQVFYTGPALADLESVMRWSWQNHPGTTERFADGLLNHVDLLKNFPYLGAPVRGHQASGAFSTRHCMCTIELYQNLESLPIAKARPRNTRRRLQGRRWRNPVMTCGQTAAADSHRDDAVCPTQYAASSRFR